MRVRTQPGQLWWPIAAVFATSILVTVLFWTILPATVQINESGDFSTFYEPVARNILAGRGFTLPDGTPAIRYPPGYPLLLAAIFWFSHFLRISEQTALSIFTLLGMGLASVFIFVLGQRVWGVVRGSISTLLWITYPFALWLTKQPNSEIPFIVVFYGGFCLFLHALLWRRRAPSIYFLSGLLVGGAMLIRPVAIGAGLVMGAILWLAGWQMTARVKLFSVATLLLGSIVAIFPWEAWVYSQTGRVVLLSTSGPSSMRDGLTFAIHRKGYRQGTSVPWDVATLTQDTLSRLSEMNSIGGITSIMAEEWRKNPLAVSKLFAIKAARSWYGTDSHRFETPIILIQLVYLGLAMWGGRIAWRQGGAAKQLVISVWLIVLYFWGMTVLALSILRYMVPTMGLLFLLIPVVFHKRESREPNL